MNADFPYIRVALQGPVLDIVLAAWRELAGEHVGTGTYSSYLAFERVYPFGGDEYSSAVLNTAPHARVLEDGHAAFHLPSAIDWAKALAKGTAKMGKRGVPYLSIPFRHGTPGSAGGGLTSTRARTMMPGSVYRDAMAATKAEHSAREAMDAVTRLRAAEKAKEARARLRAAGTQLSRPYDVLAGMYESRGVAGWRRGLSIHELSLRARVKEGHPGYTWRARTYEGLTHRAQHGAGGETTGGSWYTFRTCAADSVGWLIPAAPGFHFARRTAERVRPMVQDLIGEAARADIAAFINLEGGDA